MPVPLSLQVACTLLLLWTCELEVARTSDRPQYSESEASTLTSVPAAQGCESGAESSVHAPDADRDCSGAPRGLVGRFRSLAWARSTAVRILEAQAPPQPRAKLIANKASSFTPPRRHGAWGALLTAASLDPIGLTATDEPNGGVEEHALLLVTPMATFQVEGVRGGHFAGFAKEYVLENTGHEPFDWTVSFSASWLNVSPRDGTLAPGDTQSVAFSIVVPVAQALEVGVWAELVQVIARALTGESQERTVTTTLIIHPSDELKVTPQVGLVAMGPAGGPFTPSGTTYRLTNASNADLRWELESSASWLLLPAKPHGALEPGASVDVALTVDAGLASGWSVGEYPATFTVWDRTQNRDWSLEMQLHIAPPTGLQVTPNEPFLVAGPQGGVFIPDRRIFRLYNNGTVQLDWAAQCTVDWLTWEATPSGVLAPGQHYDLMLSVDSSAASALTPGDYSGLARFVDTTHTAQIEVAVKLQLAPGPYIDVQPIVALHFDGPQGGPFVPSASIMRLTNLGALPGAWIARINDPWLESLNALQGTLVPGEVYDLELAPAVVAANLPVGQYANSIEFLAATSNQPFERYEPTLNVALPKSAEGWTEFTPSVDTRIIYVSSSSGSDSNLGDSELRPLATLTAARARLRDGFPDWMLLRRGDVWSNQNLTNWRSSGRSAAEPMVVGAYGDLALPRPLILTPHNGNFITSGFESSTSHIAFVSLEARPTSRTVDSSCVGILWLNPHARDLHFEDLKLSNYGDNVNLRGTFSGTQSTVMDVRLHRCSILDAYKTPDPGQGMLAVGISGLRVTECLFDHNGWNEPLGVPPNQSKRNVYIQSDCELVVFTGNHTHRSSSDGIQARAGGLLNWNLMVDNRKGFAFGHRYGGPSRPGGASGEIIGNVLMDCVSLPGSAGGFGVSVGNINEIGCIVAENILLRGDSSGNGGYGLHLTSINNGFGDEPIRNLSLVDNIVYRFERPFYVRGTPGLNLTGTQVRGNHFQVFSTDSTLGRVGDLGGASFSVPADLLLANNHYYAVVSANSWFRAGWISLSFAGWTIQGGESGATNQLTPWPDPERSIEDYVVFVEGPVSAPRDLFYERVRAQRRGAWNSTYEARSVINYIREGFGLAPALDGRR